MWTLCHAYYLGHAYYLDGLLRAQFPIGREGGEEGRLAAIHTGFERIQMFLLAFARVFTWCRLKPMHLCTNDLKTHANTTKNEQKDTENSKMC